MGVDVFLQKRQVDKDRFFSAFQFVDHFVVFFQILFGNDAAVYPTLRDVAGIRNVSVIVVVKKNRVLVAVKIALPKERVALTDNGVEL